MNSSKRNLVSDAPLAALFAIATVVACNNATHASHAATKATFVDAHANAVLVDDDSEATDDAFVIEATPNAIPRTPAAPARASISFTRG